MSGAVVDLPRWRRALERLDELKREHPELIGPTDPNAVSEWEATLRESEAMTERAKRRTTRAKKAGPKDDAPPVSFRLPPELVERLDAEAARLRAATPGLKVSRTDVLRMVALKGLDLIESSR